MVARTLLLSLIAVAAPTAALAAGQTAAQADRSASDAAAPREVVVTADRAGLLERQASDLVFGLSKPLLETPRAASSVSAAALERYGVETIDQLVEISPSTYTASFYGVPGSLNIRGTLAENYFEGFKRIENRGTYATPIGDAADLQILRGPPNPIFGAGKVGGLLNFIPKSAEGASGFITEPLGSADLGLGSYGYKDLVLEGGAPAGVLTPRGGRAGVYAYVDLEDSRSFYAGVHPKRQTGEISAVSEAPGGLKIRLDAMIYHSDGDVQTPGWNRLTQALIDRGTYQAGRNASLQDLNRDGRIEANEPGAYPYGGYYQSLVCYYAGCTNPVHQLTSNVGEARLSTRTVDIGPNDFSNTTTYTTYLRLEQPVAGSGSLKLETFYDDLNNARFVSYGFPASYQTYALEERASYQTRFEPSPLVSIQTVAGAAYRYVDAHLRESYNSGIIAIDRRDLSEGPSPGDVIASPFELASGGPGWPWEVDVHSNIRDAGLFATTDIALARRVDLILGAREDDFNVSSGDRGALPYEAGGINFAHADRARGSYTASLSVRGPFGLLPYYTFDRAEALELDQASDLLPGTIGAGGRGGWLSASYLSEAGVKADALGHRLAGALSVYRQTRTQLVQGPGGADIQGTLSRGAELEIRFVATRNLSLTYAGDIQRTEVKGPDASFVYLPPFAFGVPGTLGYGGSYAATVSSLPGRAGNYELTTIPHSVNSLYAALSPDPIGETRFGLTAGATHVSKTQMIVQGGVVYPDYWLANCSAFLQRGPVRLTLNVDNVFNARYFTPNADPTYENVAALPGIGRTFRVRLKGRF